METTITPQCYVDPVTQAYACLPSKNPQPSPPAPAPIRSHSTPVLSSSGRGACGTFLFDGHATIFRPPFAQPLSTYFAPMLLPVGCWPIINKELLSRIAHEVTFGKPQPFFHDQNTWKDAITAEYARMTLQQSQLLDDAAQNKHRTSSQAAANPAGAATTATTRNYAWRCTDHEHLAIPSPSASCTTISTLARDDDSLTPTPTASPPSASPSCSPTSSRSASPAPHRSRTFRREIRRLRVENADLQERLRIMRADLVAERETRLLAHNCHQRSVEQLEVEHEDEIEQLMKDMEKEQQEAIRDKDYEIERLKQMLIESQRGAGATVEQSVKKRSGFWSGHDIVSAKSTEMSEDTTTNDRERFTTATDGEKEVINQRMPIGWCELLPLSKEQESSEEDSEEEQTSPECFAALAGSHIRQALISGLSSAMTNLCLDDLVVKHDPGPGEVARALAMAFADWAAEQMTSQQPKQTTAVLCKPIQSFWRYVFSNFVRTDDEIQALLAGIEQRIGELEREQRAGANELAERYQNVVGLLCKYDVVSGEAVVEWWQKKGTKEKVASGACHWRRPDKLAPKETDLRAVVRGVVEWYQKDSSGEEDEEDEDDEEEDEGEEGEESEEEVDDEEQDPAGSDMCPCCFKKAVEGCMCSGEGAAARQKEKKSVRFEGEFGM